VVALTEVDHVVATVGVDVFFWHFLDGPASSGVEGTGLGASYHQNITLKLHFAQLPLIYRLSFLASRAPQFHQTLRV
jgi:hypothetical protein